MSNHRARAFVPALFVQLFITLAISQHAFSQETQTTTQPAQPAVVAAADKVATKEEACEQSPATALTFPASMAQTGAGKVTVAPSQPLSFPSTRTVTTIASRPLLFEAAARNASKSFDASTFLTQDTSGGTQQTSASSYTPLTSEQKIRRGFKNAFLSPQAYALPFVSAVITEYGEDDLPHKDTDDRVADGLSRFAIKFGRRATNNVLGGVYSSVFRQDPRFERAAEGTSTGARIVHAATRVFVTRGDNGKHQPNYTRFASQLSSSALSNLWEQSTPGHDRIGTDATFRRFGNSFISGAIFNVLNEFLPDIKRIFGR
jgi:hypothetical protein